MAQYEMNLRDYWRILVKRKLIIAVTTVAIGSLTFLLATPPEPMYSAETKVLIGQVGISERPVGEVNMAQEQEVLRSQDVARLIYYSLEYLDKIAVTMEPDRGWGVDEKGQRLLDMSGLSREDEPVVVKALGQIQSQHYREQRGGDRDVESVDRPEIPPFNFGAIKGPSRSPSEAKKPLSRDARERVISNISDWVLSTVRKDETKTLLIIATARDKEAARLVADTAAYVYREYQLYKHTRSLQAAEARAHRQVDEAKGELAKVDDELGRFEEENLDALGSHRAEVRATRIEEDRQSIRDLERELALLRRPNATAEQLSLMAPSGGLIAQSPETSEIEQLRLEKVDLLNIYQPTARRIVQLDEKMSRLKETLETRIENEISWLKERILSIDELTKPEARLVRKYEERRSAVDRARDRVTSMETRYLDAQRRLAEQSVPLVEITQQAVPGLPPSPGAGRITKGAVGLVVGFVLGLVIAVLRETFDMTIGTIDEVEAYLDTQVLGVVPHIEVENIVAKVHAENPDSRRDTTLPSRASLVCQYDPKSSYAEAYRTIRTNIEFAKLQKEGKVFVITSSVLQEGKSTTAANLAVAMAQSGKKTLLIEADMRRPRICDMLGLDKEPGLHDILLDRLSWKEATKSISDMFLGKMNMRDAMMTPGLENLCVITCGGLPPNPSELLGSNRMAELLMEVRDNFDIVLCDSPPVLAVTDATILASRVDGAILVYRVRQANRGVLKRAKAHLDGIQADVWGVVLNDLKAESGDFPSESGYYQQYYVEGAEPPKGFLSRLFGGGRSKKQLSAIEPAPPPSPAPSSSFVETAPPRPLAPAPPPVAEEPVPSSYATAGGEDLSQGPAAEPEPEPAFAQADAPPQAYEPPEAPPGPGPVASEEAGLPQPEPGEPEWPAAAGNELQLEIKYLSEKLARDPDSEVFVQLADAYRRAGEVGQAIDICQEGVQRHPDNLDAHVLLGTCYYESGRVMEAQIQFLHILEFDPQNRSALRALGDIARVSDMPADALRWYQQLLDLDPLDQDVRQLVGQLRSSVGSPEAAEPGAAGSPV